MRLGGINPRSRGLFSDMRSPAAFTAHASRCASSRVASCVTWYACVTHLASRHCRSLLADAMASNAWFTMGRSRVATLFAAPCVLVVTVPASVKLD